MARRVLIHPRTCDRILCKRFSTETWEHILADICAAPIWIVETVRGICRKGREDEKDS